MSQGQGESEYPGWRRNFYTLWVAELSAIIGFHAVQPFLPYYIQEFDVGDLAEALGWSGRMGTAAGLAMAISSPIWGSLADRYGRKPMVVRSCWAVASPSFSWPMRPRWNSSW
jgi:MFS family permease